MVRPLLALALFVPLTAPLGAQHMKHDDGRASISAVHQMWSQTTGYITQVAEETPEADYGYRPTEDVRTIGEMVAHIAGAQFMICAAALGEPPRAEDAVEESASDKAAIVAELKASTAYCERAYQKTDAELQSHAELWGQQMTGFYALTLNATHNGEHYGNLVTYQRMQGIVPPSSRRGM